MNWISSSKIVLRFDIDSSCYMNTNILKRDLHYLSNKIVSEYKVLAKVISQPPIFFCRTYIWILNFICTGQCLPDTEVGNTDPGKSSINRVDPEEGLVLTRCYFTKFVQRSNSYKQDSLLSPKHIPTFTSKLSI